MAGIPIIQQSFNGGHMAATMAGRDDLAKQHIAVSKISNMIPTVIGSAKNRGGLRYTDKANSADYRHRLIPFTFGDDDNYLLEFGQYTMRILQDDALLLKDIVDAAYRWTLSADGTGNYYLELAAGGDPSITAPSHVLQNSVEMTEGTLGALLINETAYGDSAGDALGFNTIYARIFDSTDPDLQAAGYLQIPLSIVTPYTAAQVQDLDYSQSADVMDLTHGSVHPYQVIRSGALSWEVTITPFIDGPYVARKKGDDEITVTPSAKTGNGVTCEWSSNITWPSVGLPVRFGHENPLDPSILSWGWAKVASIVDADTITVDIQEDLGFEYLLNPKFNNALTFWEDRSTGVSSTSYSATSNVAQLNQGASGNAFLSQEISVNPRELLTVEVVVDTIGGGGTLRIFIGNTALASDVLPTQSIVAPGTYTYNTIINQPTGSSVHVTMQTFAGTPDYTHEVSRVSAMRKDLSTTNWRRGAIDADKGFPKHVTRHEQRVVYGNLPIDGPDTIYETKIGEHLDFGFNTPPQDDDAISYTLASDKVNSIQFLTNFTDLIAGTTGAEFKINSGNNVDAMAPGAIVAKPKGYAGNAPIKPIVTNSSLLVVQKNKKVVYDLRDSLEADRYEPKDLTTLAPDLFENRTIDEWARQESPDSTIWCVMSDGALLGFTYNAQEDVWAWSEHYTEGKFESVGVISENNEDVVYVMVKRMLIESGVRVAKRYIERLMPQISNEAIYDWFTVDSGATLDIENDIPKFVDITGVVMVEWNDIVKGKSVKKWKVWVTYTDAATWDPNGNDYIYISNVVGTTEVNNLTFRAVEHQNNPFGAGKAFILKDKEGIDYIDGNQYSQYVSGGQVRKGVKEITGLRHLLGKTVSVIADGSVVENKAVVPLDDPATKWGFDLDQAAIVVHAGLPFTTDLRTLPLDVTGGESQTTQALLKSLVETNIHFNKTKNAWVGVDEDSLEQIMFTDISSENNPSTLFTGIKTEKPESGKTELLELIIQNSDPVPIEIVGLINYVLFESRQNNGS